MTKAVWPSGKYQRREQHQGTRGLSGGEPHLPDREEAGNAAGMLEFSLDELARTVLSSLYLGGNRYPVITAKKDGFWPCKLTTCLLFGLWGFSFFPILVLLPLLYYFQERESSAILGSETPVFETHSNSPGLLREQN